jgi:hypothetical protein
MVEAKEEDDADCDGGGQPELKIRRSAQLEIPFGDENVFERKLFSDFFAVNHTNQSGYAYDQDGDVYGRVVEVVYDAQNYRY